MSRVGHSILSGLLWYSEKNFKLNTGYTEKTKYNQGTAYLSRSLGISCKVYLSQTLNIGMQILALPPKYISLTLSQCTLGGPVYTGMSLECHWLTQCTLGYHWATQRILAGYTGTPLEKLDWNSPTLECHWRNLVESTPHWDATGETLTFAAYIGTPLEGLWQPTHAPTHIVKHAE